MPEYNNIFKLHAMKGLARDLGNLFVQIAPLEGGITYEIEEKDIGNVVLLIPEFSGDYDNRAVVVCDINGNPLQPLDTTDPENSRYSFPSPYNAVFVGKELVTVLAHRRYENEYSINKNSIFKIGLNSYMVETKTIGGGKLKIIPPELECFSDAIKAAEIKKQCGDECSHTHFSL